MEYVNRTKDFENIISSVRDYDITYVLAGKAYGLTSFMYELGNRLSQYRVFILNTVNGNNIANLLISDIIQSNDRDNFRKMVERELGEKSTSLLSAVLQGIPYAGPLLAQFVESKEISPIYAGNYASAIEEIILPYIKKYSKTKNILICLDEAQNMSEESYNLVANLAQCDDVKIILGITDTIGYNYIKLKNRLLIYSTIKCNMVLFAQPEETLIRELSNHLGLTFSNSQIKAILNQTNRNIHLIIDCMLDIASAGKRINLYNEIDKAVISFLHICYFGLNEFTLKSLISMSNVFFMDLDLELEKSLNKLEEYGCVIRKKTLNISTYLITALYHPETEKCINNFTDMLYYKNIVFDYFRRPGMPNVQELLDLMYQLSLEFSNQNVKEYAIELLKCKLEKGETISADIFANAKLSKKINSEIELGVLYYTRERHYNEALKWIESMRGKRKNYHYQILKGVLLNRVRRFSEAEEFLLNSINLTRKPYILNTLLAYFTANCIHTNQKENAISEYYKRKSELDGTENWGYFLRNLASAVQFPLKETLLKEAIDNFSIYKDDYGIYSCKCNWGNALCVANKAEDGLSFLKEAEVGLQKFGPNHLHIIYNDLGVCYLSLGDIQNSQKYISLAEKLAYNRMPRIITTINKACLLAITCKTKQSLKELDNIQDAVLAHPVLSIRQKYFTNRLLVEFIISKDSYCEYISKNKAYIDNYVDTSIFQIYQQMIQENKQIEYPSKIWNTLFKPGGLAYWYVDPLKMI